MPPDAGGQDDREAGGRVRRQSPLPVAIGREKEPAGARGGAAAKGGEPRPAAAPLQYGVLMAGRSGGADGRAARLPRRRLMLCLVQPRK